MPAKGDIASRVNQLARKRQRQEFISSNGLVDYLWCVLVILKHEWGNVSWAIDLAIGVRPQEPQFEPGKPTCIQKPIWCPA